MLPGGSIGLTIPDMLEGTEFENLGTTVEVIAKGGTMSVGGVTYTLQQFHFHLPSEHLDNGTSMAMEMHMVWQGPAQQVAVIGVFIDLTPEAGAAVAPVAAAPAPAPAAVVPVAAAPEVAAAPAKRWSAKDARRRRDGMRGLVLPEGVAPISLAPIALAEPTSSTLLETVFTSVEAISVPGTKTETQALVMSELVQTLVAGGFMR